MCSAIKDDHLSKLRVIRLTNCEKISKSAIVKLLEVSWSKGTSLSLIICDKIFKVDFHDQLTRSNGIASTNWSILPHEEVDTKRLIKFPLAMQFHYLFSKFKSKIPELNDKNTNQILLDIMFHNQPFGFDSAYYMLDFVSRNRINSRHKVSPQACCLMIDKNKKVKPLMGITTEDPSKEVKAHDQEKKYYQKNSTEEAKN
ncbi:hypothetical protein PSN45_003064 [Yamadazyma tenuis]|uniref:uncharacterized protein n=1 Tax=Candida tenuis TaxID=2315449 RepID=UPI00279909E7|nr:hypothetical protein PSN45_003064 [Yamadazyma tenuis]